MTQHLHGHYSIRTEGIIIDVVAKMQQNVKLGKVEKDIIKFSKYHGAGNDLIMIDNMNGEYDEHLKNETLIRAMCCRRFGIGSDGLVELKAYNMKGYAFEMVFYRALGMKGSFGGNAARCSVGFAYALGLFRHNEVAFVGSDGIHTAVYSKANAEAEVNLGDISSATVLTYNEFFIDTGSPHHVVFLENKDLDSYDIIRHGEQICDCDQYKTIGGTNVNFVVVEEGGKAIRIRTYERGVRGEIMACGTGAVASAIIHEIRSHRLDEVSGRAPSVGILERATKVSCPYGDLEVRYSHKRGEMEFNDVRLKGPVRHVYNGQYRIPKVLRADAVAEN